MIWTVSGTIVAVLSLLAIGAALLFAPAGARVASPPIRIDTGVVQGYARDGIVEYRGLPFARPPVGDLRWRPPQLPSSWEGTLRAENFKPACMQAGPTVPGMAVEPTSEDCLYLNVWTPEGAANARLPVMVWMYGGGNANGSGSARLYRGDQLAKRRVVVVSYNYRLAGFATLAHPDLTRESGYGASGNYSLLDDIAALTWVRRNIASFGGDPNNVTIFGQSAGAYHASQLMVSPLARGLFRRVIAQSGGAFHPAGTEAGVPRLAQAEQTGIAYAKALGATSLADLRRVPAADIVALDSRTRYENGAPRGPNSINIDGYVLPADVHDLYERGAAADVDLLVGYNAADGELAHRWAARTWARMHAQGAKSSVFLYRFTRVPPFRPWPQLKIAGHGAELPYVFGYPPNRLFFVFELPWNAFRDIRLADAMQTYWTNFARTGDPNGEGVPVWPEFRKTSQLMNLGVSIGAMAPPDNEEQTRNDAYIASLRAPAERSAGGP
jgi:para-nitrobenzyl esterase